MHQNRQTSKKTYVKPQLEEIRLEAEEAVLQICKADAGASTGKTNGKCLNPWICNSVGS